MGFSTSIKEWLGRTKDAASSTAAEHLLKTRLKNYIQMLDLKIDSETKTVTAHVLPKGEKEAIQITVAAYEIIEENGVNYFVARKAHASREWMNVMVQQFVVGRRFELPEKYVKLLKLAL